MRNEEKFLKKLFVEGNDDRHVVWALCEKAGIVQNFDVIDCEGIENLVKRIPIRVKTFGIEAIGVIVDADSDIDKRWRTLCILLESLGYAIPLNLPKGGLIIKQDDMVTIGVWIMPNNSLNGMIEDFIAFLVPENDRLLGVANASLDKIESESLNKYNVIHRSKALIHTWLAWQEDPGTPMGASITKRYLTTDADICNTFIDWLKNVCN